MFKGRHQMMGRDDYPGYSGKGGKSNKNIF